MARSTKLGAQRRVQREQTRADFPIVGIGASAGGLEAFTEFVSALPEKTGAAFVLVQHLDPTHKSSLVEILQRKTSLSMEEVTDNARVEPDHIYVIPPNSQLSIRKGVLKLVKGARDQGVQHSIDSFFHTLARDCGPAAIGVVLSGSASDGSHGLEQIKEHGGITFAQAEESARFTSMPRNAISTGSVDFILPPKQIAEQIIKVAARPELLIPELPVEKPAKNRVQTSFDKILALLRLRLGVDLTLYKPLTLSRRVKRRMALRQTPDTASYLKFLRAHPEELEGLYQDLLINVTRFFRDSEIFERLKEEVFPRLLKNRAVDAPVRVWVAGCSTGQEAYSIAIAFLEYAAKVSIQVPIRIFATDLNESVLEKARVGFYTKNQVQDVAPQRLRRFFVEEDGGLRVCKPVRELVVFARHDVLADPPFSRMDVVSCRNVMIYLEPVLQKKLIPLFHYALKPKGFLLLGASETLGGSSDLFASEGKKIFSRKDTLVSPHANAAPHPQPKALSRTAKSRGLTAGVASELDVQKEADRLALAKYSPAGVLVNESMEILQFRGQTSAFLEPTPGRASYNLLKMLREGLLLPVRSALDRAKKRNQPVRTEQLEFRYDGQTRNVAVEVMPVKASKQRCFLVVFESNRNAGKQDGPLAAHLPLPVAKKDLLRDNARLRGELEAAKDYLQSVTEEHDAAQEELQASTEEAESSNEELQSINEELETTKEELESTNEELTTVNEEMNTRNSELHLIVGDLNNILASAQLCVVVLRSDLTIRRFTPLAEKILNVVPTDIGRPITHIQPNLDLPNLEEKLLEVIHTVRSSVNEVRDRQGRWYSLRLFPYKTLDNRIDGAVMVLVDIDALKRSEQQTKVARDYAESTFEAVREPLAILSADLKIQRANRSFFKYFRVSPVEIIGHSLSDLGRQHWKNPKLENLLRDILPRNAFFDDFEIEGEFDRVGPRTLLLSARPIVGETETPQSILLAFDDATERKQFETLKESEHRFRTLAEALPQLVWTAPPDGRCDYFNGRWTEYTGLPREKLLGDQWRDSIHDDDRVRTCDYWVEALKGTVPYDLEFRLRRADGTYHWFKVRANPVMDTKGKPIKWFGTCTDIEDQKQSQLLIEQSETWLRLIMESVKDFALFTTDPKGRIVDWNPGAQNVFGYSAEEILGQDAAVLFTPEDREKGMPKAELKQAESEGCAMDERWHVRKNGERLFVSGAVRAIRDENGTLRGFTKVARDITDKKRQQEELQRAHDDLERRVMERTAKLGETVQDLETFSYSISHDLRAPLRAMLGFAHLALNDPTLGPKGRQAIERIVASANRLDRLIVDVLAYSRVTQAAITLQPVDLDALVREVVHQYPGLQSPEVTINIEGPLLPVVAHEAALTQCVANFLNNAIKFVPDGSNPYIRIWTSRVDDCVRLSVQDNGIGIAESNLHRIFGIFERLNASNQPWNATGR